jgi:hypothetical protein
MTRQGKLLKNINLHSGYAESGYSRVIGTPMRKYDDDHRSGVQKVIAATGHTAGSRVARRL